MKSLKARLALASVFAMLVVVALCGGLIYELIEDDLEDEFDRSLKERARAQTALVEFDEEGLQFEWEHSPQLIEAKAVPRWFQVRTLEGKLLSHSERMPQEDFAYPLLDDEKDMSEDDDVTLPNGRAGRAITLRFTPNLDDEATETPPDLLLIVAEPIEPMEDTLEDFQELIGLTALIGVGLSVVLVWLILWRELRPLDELARKIGAIDKDALARKIEVNRAPGELRPVIDQLNGMLARVDDTLRREQEFTSGAAHELRTPLAGIRAKLELALSRERSSDEHRDFAQQSLDIAIGIQGVVERLLNLARLEGGEVLGEAKATDLKHLAEDAWKPYASKAKERELEVRFDVKSRTALLHADAMKVVLSNLFENAVNYTDPGGRVNVHDFETDGVLSIRVENEAGGISEEEAARATEPFWRSDEARRDPGVHAGLGLPLCRRIVEAMGGKFWAGKDTSTYFVAQVDLPNN